MMARRMQWTSACRLDIEEIDAQHCLLFAIANEMLDFDNSRDQLPEFKFLFNHLRRYINEHFTHEGDFMQSIDYPQLAAQQGKHQAVVIEINGLLQDSKNLNELHLILKQRLWHWVKEPILVEDQKYARWYHQSDSSQK
jgi:hemerythrin